jgi:hypothetical protein
MGRRHTVHAAGRISFRKQKPARICGCQPTNSGEGECAYVGHIMLHLIGALKWPLFPEGELAPN